LSHTGLKHALVLLAFEPANLSDFK
jgi:hypothetical protein